MASSERNSNNAFIDFFMNFINNLKHDDNHGVLLFYCHKSYTEINYFVRDP